MLAAHIAQIRNRQLDARKHMLAVPLKGTDRIPRVVLRRYGGGRFGIQIQFMYHVELHT
jgi:hypothetical protein